MYYWNKFYIFIAFFNKLSTYKYWTFKNKLLYQFALTLSLYITFGFRQNAFTIIPALILAIFYLIKKKNKNKSLGLNQLLSICISLMLVFMVPSITKVEIKIVHQQVFYGKYFQQFKQCLLINKMST